jgi:hypothetical protein
VSLKKNFAMSENVTDRKPRNSPLKIRHYSLRLRIAGIVT